MEALESAGALPTEEAVFVVQMQAVREHGALAQQAIRVVNIEVTASIGKPLFHRRHFRRILGEVREEYLEPLAKADHIFIEELRNHDLYDDVSQAFAVFLPVKSVGVVGDQRRYEWVVALRAVETIDFMTAIWARLPYEFLEKVSLRIINEISGISRVVYDISGKPPATIEWE